MKNQEFKRGDLVQVRDRAGQEWKDARYVAYTPEVKYCHVVLRDDAELMALPHGFCRHMPTATDEEVAMLTDIEPTENLETKLDNAIAVINGAIAHLNAEINELKKQLK